MAGLSAAVLLAARGVPVTVVERMGAPGGKLRTVDVAGVPVDAGPTVFTHRPVFERIFAHCGAKPAELFTYSSATAVRVALLAGGFLVGEGVSTGPRAATTVAMTRLDGVHHGKDAPKLLGADWLARWRRSDAKFPASLPVEARAEFERRIEQHPQFARLA